MHVGNNPLNAVDPRWQQQAAEMRPCSLIPGMHTEMEASSARTRAERNEGAGGGGLGAGPGASGSGSDMSGMGGWPRGAKRPEWFARARRVRVTMWRELWDVDDLMSIDPDVSGPGCR